MKIRPTNQTKIFAAILKTTLFAEHLIGFTNQIHPTFKK